MIQSIHTQVVHLTLCVWHEDTQSCATEREHIPQIVGGSNSPLMSHSTIQELCYLEVTHPWLVPYCLVIIPKMSDQNNCYPDLPLPIMGFLT